jgi:hypothetical protein
LENQGKPNGYYEVRSQRLGYTAFFYVKNVGRMFHGILKDLEKDNVSRSPGKQYLQDL